MGAVMTSCLGMPHSSPPIRKKKDKGTVFNEGHPTEQTDYFDCIDNEIIEVEEKKLKDKSD